MGERLHEFDIDLTDYAIGNVVQYLTDPRFGRWVVRHVTTPTLIDHIRRRADRNVDAPQVRSLFADAQMGELAAAFEDGPPGGPWAWVPYPELHRRYIETVGEVRAGLTRQVAEEWSADCGGYARRLEAGGLSLPDGIAVVREWVGRLRSLQLAMDDERFVPAGDRPRPHPLTPPPGDGSAPDPRYPGLTVEQIVAVERMRAAIQNAPKGAHTKAEVLVKLAKINNQVGRSALNWLKARGEYLPHSPSPGDQPPGSTDG